MKFDIFRLLLLVSGILILQNCRSIPEKISDRRLINLSDLEKTSVEELVQKVILTKHLKDSQILREETEGLRLRKMKREHDKLPAGTEKQDRAREVDALDKICDVEKKKTRVAELELGAAIAALERQKARIISVRSKSEMNSEVYETESDQQERELATEKAELARLIQGQN